MRARSWNTHQSLTREVVGNRCQALLRMRTPPASVALAGFILDARLADQNTSSPRAIFAKNTLLYVSSCSDPFDGTQQGVIEMLASVRFAVFLATLLGLAASVGAQVELRHKVPDGARSTTATKTKTVQRMTLKKMVLESQSDQTFSISSVNGRRSNDGVIRVKHSIDSLKVKATLPGGTVLKFDSTAVDATPPGTRFDFLLEVFEAMSKSTWTVVHDKHNRVVAVEGRDKSLNSLSKRQRKPLKKKFDPDYLKRQANDKLDRIPRGPVSKGDTWKRTNTVRLDSGQMFTFTTRYEYRGVVNRDGKQFDQIDTKTTDVSYATDADATVRVLKSDLKIVASSGVMLFDRQVGQIVAESSKTHVNGELRLKIANSEYPGTLDLTMERQSQLTLQSAILRDDP
jgi:hypothetical protein